MKQELEINQQLSQRLITATENGNQLMQQNIKVKNWLERALQSERNIKEQIARPEGQSAVVTYPVPATTNTPLGR